MECTRQRFHSQLAAAVVVVVVVDRYRTRQAGVVVGAVPAEDIGHTSVVVQTQMTYILVEVAPVTVAGPAGTYS